MNDKRVDPRAIASILGSTPEFAQAVCSVLGELSDNEIERTAAPVLAEKITAEHKRILRRGREQAVVP